MDKKSYSVDELLQYAYKYNTIPDVLFAKDTDGRYIYASKIEPAIKSGEEKSILGKTDIDIQYDKELGKMFYEQDMEIIKTGKPMHCYSEFYVHGKKEVREISKSPVYSNGKIIGVSGVVSDVTELMRLKEQFEKMSMIDRSTGCYNRNYSLKNDYNKQEKLPCAYIMCDCNELKNVNDQYGHEAGDKYILLASDVLRLAVDKRGICIRWGGDEFLLIVPNCDEDDCRKIIDKIEYEQCCKRKFLPELNISMGFCIRTTLEQSESDVIKTADEAMYRDKAERKSGKNGD